MGGGQTYVYAWGNNPKRARLKGRRCTILARGTMRSCLVRFLDDGSREVVSLRALRREPPAGGTPKAQGAIFCTKRTYPAVSGAIHGPMRPKRAHEGKISRSGGLS